MTMKFRSVNKKISRGDRGTLRIFILSTVAIIAISFFFPNFIKKQVFNVGNFFGTSKNVAANILQGVSSPFLSNSVLLKENHDLKEKLFQAQIDLVQYEAVRNDNNVLRQTIGLETDQDIYKVHATVQAGATNMSEDQILIDKGLDDGVIVGDLITAYEHMPLGLVQTVYQNSSIITLLSAFDKTTNVLIGDKAVAAEAKGKSLGAFEIKLPKGSGVNVGDSVILKGYSVPLSLGLIKSIESPENSPFEIVRMSLPVNPNSISYVGIIK